MNIGKFYTSACLGALIFGVSSSAMSQVPIAENVQNDNTGGEVADIVVTAQKRSESAQKVPLAVSAVTAVQLINAGVSNSLDLKLAIPSVDVQNANGYAVAFIRGIGSKQFGPGTESPVSLYVDGVYIGAGAAGLMSFNDISRVEVLKGPQGTLFGRNATGGLISIVTRDPTDHLAGEVHAGYGNYDTLHGDLYVGGPIAANVRADFAAYVNHQGNGYGTNLLDGSDVYKTYYDYGLRSKWMIDLGETFHLQLIGDYAKTKNSQTSQRIAYGSPPPPYVGYGGDPWDTNVNITPLVHNFARGVSGRLSKEFGDFATLSSTTAYRRNDLSNQFDADYTAINGRIISFNQLDRQFSQELQLVSGPSSPFKWTIGAFYWNAKGQYAPSALYYYGVAQTSAFSQNITNGQQSVRSFAPYAQSTFELFDRTNLTLGIRYTTEKRHQITSTVLLRPDNTQVGATASVDKSFTANKPSWRIALDHQFTNDVMGYLSYNRGFKSGGGNAGSTTAPFFQPEQIDAYEAGLKTTLLDRKLRLNGALFYYDYKGIQVLRVVDGIVTVYNGARARTYGAEFEIEAHPTRQLTLNGGFTYLDAKFAEFPDSVLDIVNPTGGYYQIIGSAKGNRLPTAPKATLTASATYDIPIGADHLSFTGNYYHNSGYFGEPDNVVKQGAYSNVGGNIRYAFGGGLYDVVVWGKNLTNVAVNVYPATSTTGGRTAAGFNLGVPKATYMPPRTFGITLGAKF